MQRTFAGMYFKVSLRKNPITREIQGLDKVERRIGRIIQKYSSASTHYDFEVETNRNIATNIIFYRKDSFTYRQDHRGVYFIRTSLYLENERRVWEIPRIANMQKMVPASGKNTSEEIISIRKCTEPQSKVKETARHWAIPIIHFSIKIRSTQTRTSKN